MASALLRAGYTPDRMQMYYVLAGYTYGRFSMVGLTDFGMNGATVGAGYERVIGPGWTVKVEGRYTKFADANVPSTAVSSSSTSGPVTGGTATTAFSSASASTYNVSADIFTARVGITKYFNPGDGQ
jgi:opacity protein-like surface antigen